MDNGAVANSLHELTSRGPLGTVHGWEGQMTAHARTRHAHESLHFCLILHGDMEQRLSGHWTEISECTVRISPPGATAELKFGLEGAHCFVLEYDDLEPEDCRALSPSNPMLMKNRGSLALAFDALEAFRNCAAGLLQLETSVLELFALGRNGRERCLTPPPPWLRRTRDWLHDGFQRPLRLADAAEAAQISPVHLSRAFRRHFGCTMGAYLRALRIEHARRALVTGECSLQDLAQEAGFYDQSHMTRSFKSALGVAPGVYRRIFIKNS